MAEKDVTEKILMSYADVFADCENVLNYDGKILLKPEELQCAPTESFYKGSGKSHDQFCDVSFYWVKHGKIVAQYMIENETQLKRRQVLRKASYEGGAYREQLESGQPVYPVISCVLEWSRGTTRIPLSLHRLLTEDGAVQGVPATGEKWQDALSLVDDIHLIVHHMNNLPPETRKLFVSDMGFVADYLNEGNFEARKSQQIVHVKELCDMMEALTGDRRFTDLAGELLQRQQERKGVIMCEYIDMLEAKGATKGENRLAKLIQLLLKEHRYTDLAQAAHDSEKRHELYRAYGI